MEAIDFLKKRQDICDKYKDKHCCECPLLMHKCGYGKEHKEILSIIMYTDINK